MVRCLRWVQRVVFVAFLAPFSAGATVSIGMAPVSTQAGRVGGITTGTGPVMTGRVNVYVIWYGSNFPADTKSIVQYFISNWGGSHSYAVLRNYTGSNGRVAPELVLAGVSTPAVSKTALTDDDIRALVTASIPNTFPADSNGIYVVMVGRGISVNSGTGGTLCGSYCGWHNVMTVNGVDIKYALDGSGNCSTCQVPSSPNNNLYADQMVNTLAHEIGETVTDPDRNAWGSGASNDEVGDKCNFDFSEKYFAPNNAQATAKVGQNYYMIQKLWSPTAGGGCYSGYSAPAALIWQQGPGGAIGAWKMKDQNTVASFINYNSIPLGQRALGVGDFSNGIDPQLLTIATSGGGPVTMWTLHADGTTSSDQMFPGLGAGYNITGTSDLNGDGFGDIVLTNPSSGDVQVFLMQGTTLLSAQDFGSFLPWLPLGTADFDGDGLADIFWVDTPDQQYTIWLSSVSGGGSSVSFTDWGVANMTAAEWSHPFTGVLGVGDLNGDSRADVLFFPVNWSGHGDGILFADFIISPFEQNDRWVANSIFPDFPTFFGMIDVNRDGTSDFYMQTSAGVKFFRMGTWKDTPQVFGPLPSSDPFTDFAVASSSAAFSDSGWVTVGAGTFKEN